MTEQERKDLALVKHNGYALQLVTNQTEQICLAAVKRNGMALEYVKNQTEQLCLEAVKSSGGRVICNIEYNKIYFYITGYRELDEDVNNPFLF